jgi:hypothetical protein
MPSRSRVRGLAAVLHSLKFLESGEHEINYVVAADDDDQATIDFVNGEIPNHKGLRLRVGPRDTTLGGLINKTANENPADVYLVINDDILVLSYQWDKTIAEAVEKTPYGVFWWKNATPEEVLFPIVTEAWRAASGGIFTDHYPFWYDDLCLTELWMMTTSQENIVLPVYVCDRPRTVTHRMRDLVFWQEVYKKTRVLRVQKAHEMAEKLGLEKPQAALQIGLLMQNHMKRVSDEWIQSIENMQGDPASPDQAYLDAKKRAEDLIANLDYLKAA